MTSANRVTNGDRAIVQSLQHFAVPLIVDPGTCALDEEQLTGERQRHCGQQDDGAWKLWSDRDLFRPGQEQDDQSERHASDTAGQCATSHHCEEST